MKRSDISPMPIFFDRYINLVDDIDLSEAFQKHSPDQVFQDLTKLLALGDQVYKPGKWTIKDIIQHIIDNERIMGYRALRFSRNDKTVLPGYDEVILASNSNAANRTLMDLMEEFNMVRSGTIALFKSMTDEMAHRSGVAFQSEISALALGFVIVGHPIHHMRVVEERYFPLVSPL